MSRLSFDEKQFYLDNKPIQILSGAIHYFRVVPEYWHDRLMKLKQCGFNTVETVTCWNQHEKQEGSFDFQGILDIGRFIDEAARVGLYVILRPGPYTCAEMSMGGLPYWLLKDPEIKIRCNNEPFLKKVRAYYHELFKIIRPRLIENGGNIIAVQIENEYGSFGDDREYLKKIKEIYEEEKVSCLMFTSDGPGYFMLSGGTLEGVLATVNFGSNPKDNFNLLRQFRNDQPQMCMEYWNGWFDHWYEQHHERESGETADVFEEMVSAGHSVNLYMFHGGTNFGLINGANYDEHIQPVVTSYDYNCPVSECGDLTDKYYEIHDRLEKIFNKKLPITALNSEKKAYGKLEFTHKADLFDNLDKLAAPIDSRAPLSFEEMDIGSGIAVYTTEFDGPFEELELEIDGLADRASVYIDDRLQGIKEATGKRWDKVQFGLSFGEKAQVKIVIEDMGRVNYGGHIFDKKGICRGVRIANRYHFGWKIYPIDLSDITRISYKQIDKDIESCKPGFYKALLDIDTVKDTFIKPIGFSKGFIWINGFNIGRFYNTAGPQKTLYVPAPLLRTGENEIEILELDECIRPEVVFVDKEEL